MEYKPSQAHPYGVLDLLESQACEREFDRKHKVLDQADHSSDTSDVIGDR